MADYTRLPPLDSVWSRELFNTESSACAAVGAIFMTHTHSRRPIRCSSRFRQRLGALCLGTLLLAVFNPAAIGGETLARCLALSQQDQAVHNCLDNMLDQLDATLTATDAWVAAQMDDQALDAFNAAAQTFFSFRRSNCLWYQSFNGRDAQADWLAKECLVDMTEQRLRELRGLIEQGDPTARVLRGVYVYGTERNSFQPCGTRQRYWVEGDASAVGELQQRYLAAATEELQWLFVELDGQLVPGEATMSGHAGEVNLRSVRDLRLPRDGDCAGASVSAATQAETSVPEPGAQVEEPDADTELADTEETEQQLRAYFGDWEVLCLETDEQLSCTLQTPLLQTGDESAPQLRLQLEQRFLRLLAAFPGQEIDRPNRVRWSVDDTRLGELLGAEVRVDEGGTEVVLPQQVLDDSGLLAAMLEAERLDVEVVNDPGDEQGLHWLSSLLGLQRALDFSIEFLADAQAQR